MSKTIKILIAYHKKSRVFRDNVLTPIQVGAAIFKKNNNDEKLKNWFLNNMLQDDEGDNISLKNNSFNELTATYWAWKNYNKLGNPEYIGFAHYCRHFIFKEDKTATYECNQYDESYLSEKLNYSKMAISYYLEKADFIVPKPFYYKSVREQYNSTLNSKDLEDAIALLHKLKPEYSKYCEDYLSNKASFFYNMFIMPKKMFFEYCEFIFPLLFEYERTHDLTGKRLFISERLTGIFIYSKMMQKYKCQYLPIMYFEEQITIPVVLATDHNYLKPTIIAISSLLFNSKPSSIYEIHILIPPNTADTFSLHFDILRNTFKNCSITLHEMNQYEYPISIDHTSICTYYRLFIPQIINESKCIYLDSDVIVCSDLAKLYRLDITERYIAGVKAASYFYPKKWVDAHSKEIGIPIEDYINAGVLLLNLQLIRQDRIDSKMLYLASKGFSSQDQDAINIACHNHIRCLDYTYNLMTKYLQKDDKDYIFNNEAVKVYNLKNNRPSDNPTIIHYADKIKPWGGKCIYDEFWHLYDDRLTHLAAKYKISVIVPVFNKETWLKQCLDSILSQTLKEIEIIVIDDGSTDSSLKILETYANQDRRILLIKQTNHGVGYSRNKGLKNSCGKYVCFMDPDDYYPNNTILETLYVSATTYNVNIAGGSWSEQHPDGTIKTTFTGKYRDYTFMTENITDFSEYQFDYGFQRFIFSLEMLRNNNILFPEYIRYQDPPFLLKAMIASKKFYAVTSIVYCYRYGHKKIAWDEKTIGDLILGLIENIRISSKYKLEKIHKLNVDRLNHEYADRIIECISTTNNRKLLEYLVRANSSINRALLATIIPSITEDFCLIPLQRLITEIDYTDSKLITIIKKFYKKFTK